jgi:hypothetical protein
MNAKPRKPLKLGLIFAILAVSSIVATNTISSKLQQTPRISVLQPESALAQTPTRQSPDAIVRWNALTLDIIKAEKTSGPMAARNLAMVHAASYDAAKAIGLALMTSPVWRDCRAWYRSPSNASNLVVCRCALPS